MQTLETTPAELSRFFESKHFAASCRMFGSDYEIEIETPDLTAAPATVWADWGPMYTCMLDVDRMATVTYRCLDTGREAVYRISPPTISINAPAKASVRVRHPFIIEIVDAARCVQLSGFMDREGRVTSAEVLPLHTSVDVPALMFREAALAARLGGSSLVRTSLPAPDSAWARSAAGN